MSATNEFELWLEKTDLDGLPETVVEAAKLAAKKKSSGLNTSKSSKSSKSSRSSEDLFRAELKGLDDYRKNLKSSSPPDDYSEDAFD